MPNITVKSAKKVWESSDGNRKIYELSVDVNGTELKAKTYSEVIAVVGWSGDIETYDKPGRNGVEKFVRQAPKDPGSFDGSKPSYTPRDDSHIKAQWAIGQAVQILLGGSNFEVFKDPGHIEVLAKTLFAMVDRVKDASGAEEPLPEEPVGDEEVELPPAW